MNTTNNSSAANTSNNPEVTTDESEKGARKGGSSEHKGNETMLENVMTKLKMWKGIVITAFIAFSLGFLLRPKFKVAGYWWKESVNQSTCSVCLWCICIFTHSSHGCTLYVWSTYWMKRLNNNPNSPKSFCLSACHISSF